ncbi:MAG: hydrolase, partial [Lachnospiraceae bacterium]|nr:hydrolase [Lachnospiraceae bacterium]
MKIKKLDDKPMVIHIKEKAKLHTHEPKQTKIKGHNTYTVDRSPKIKGSVMGQTVGGRTNTFRKSTIHQAEGRKTSRFRQYRNAVRESQKSIHTNKKGSSIKLAGAAGVRVAGSQMEGSEEIEQAAMIAYGVSRPVTGTASKGAELFRQRTLAEKRRRIKQVSSGKKLAKRTVKKTSQKVAKKAAKDTSKAVA